MVPSTDCFAIDNKYDDSGLDEDFALPLNTNFFLGLGDRVRRRKLVTGVNLIGLGSTGADIKAECRMDAPFTFFRIFPDLRLDLTCSDRDFTNLGECGVFDLGVCDWDRPKIGLAWSGVKALTRFFTEPLLLRAA